MLREALRTLEEHLTRLLEFNLKIANVSLKKSNAIAAKL